MAKNNSTSEEIQKKKRESQRILDRVKRESEQIGTFSISRLTNKAGKSLVKQSGENAPEDYIEIMGKRIARVLAVIMFVALAATLYLNYIVPQ